MSKLKILEQIREQLKEIESLPKETTYDDLYSAYMLSRHQEIVGIENEMDEHRSRIMDYSHSFGEEDITSIAELTESFMEYWNDLEAIKRQGREVINHILYGIKIKERECESRK